MIDFSQFPLIINVIIFVVAAAFVWIAGAKISRYADAISVHTNFGHALLGLLLLGGVTSLPELAVSVSAAASGSAALAVNNILGGVTMQVAILAVADFAIGRRALTSVVPDPVVILQGSLNVLLLTIVPIAILVGDVSVFGIGAWTWLILAFAIGSIYLLSRSEGRRPWQASNIEPRTPRDGEAKKQTTHGPLYEILTKTVIAAATILAAGYVISRTAEIIAEQTGLGQSFVGAVLVAISTSLPEVSTVLSAVRLGLYTMAISDILGTNLFDVGLLFAVDAVSSGDPVMNRVGSFSAVAALLGIAVTALFLIGLTERRDRTILRMGMDSAAVIIVYLGGLALLYSLRGAS
ncbi:sodium:calcium antiporter [Pseudorhodoplanes sinuspersici]|uniref:Sodium:calcium exchanger n=1 Tax=Pseudorhodoplanes sinuspersici TaxID=1235591 RepID=A0A1W6ZQJ4_9HYPH|nr:sodium:calcium exchanger [Pseudorhodoplanes sinuspersici]ARP99656.1 sodium:calcium exchanger [Pseudorhodoplanes sinuspersici]RKE70635.1 cation:H+ antiporter [Pseudorhodoplanes sinuspersici]